jgi:hypothetical protein
LADSSFYVLKSKLSGRELSDVGVVKILEEIPKGEALHVSLPVFLTSFLLLDNGSISSLINCLEFHPSLNQYSYFSSALSIEHRFH